MMNKAPNAQDNLPMSDVSAALRYLSETREALAVLGNPQNSTAAIHIAGTAGKGSTAAYIDAILRSHGHRTARFTSPHVLEIGERFVVNGRPVSPSNLAKERSTLAALTSQTVIQQLPTFAVYTLMAFQLFARSHLDYMIIEVGIGGEFDPTNTISRDDKIAVITAIDLDHTNILGGSLESIAEAKAGIIPMNGSCFAIEPGRDEILHVLENTARIRNTTLHLINTSPPGTGVDAGSSSVDCEEVPSITAAHQLDNAELAKQVVRHIAARDSWSFDSERAHVAIRATHLLGRCQQVQWRERTVILDVAHNPLKFRALSSWLRRAYPNKEFCFLVSCAESKDYISCIEEIVDIANHIIATKYTDSLGVPAPVDSIVMRDRILELGVPATLSCDVTNGLAKAIRASSPDDPIVVCGSFLTVSEALRAMATATTSRD